AASQAYDGTDALPDVRPPGRVDGAAGTVVGVERCRAAGAAPGGRGAAAPEPEAEAGLGRPGGARSPGPSAPQAAADAPPGRAGHAAALARGLVRWRWTYPRRGGRPPTGAKIVALIEPICHRHQTSSRLAAAVGHGHGNCEPTIASGRHCYPCTALPVVQ